uniref:Uncharacterized protein n=1 Tax=Aegilops tauschii subsp. strangulata TaxID=200361 RepID=A0A453B0B7_AEGTS
VQLHGGRLQRHDAGGERPNQPLPAVDVHARLRRGPHQLLDPSGGRRGQRHGRRSPGALRAAAPAAALLLLIDASVDCKFYSMVWHSLHFTREYHYQVT